MFRCWRYCATRVDTEIAEKADVADDRAGAAPGAAGTRLLRKRYFVAAGAAAGAAGVAGAAEVAGAGAGAGAGAVIATGGATVLPAAFCSAK